MVNTVFETKKATLLANLKMLALRHNRDYYISMIPFVEKAGPEESGLIDMYQDALDTDGAQILHSRDALESITKVENILVS